MRHDTKDVEAKLQEAVQSYVDRGLARVLDDVELRLARQLARAGEPQLAIEHLTLKFFDLSARADDLENVKQVRPATPEQFAKMAAEWNAIFPGSEPPSQWTISRLEMGHK